jgi:MFS family permease
VLTASLFGYATTVGVFPLLHDFAAIALARFLDGAFSVGIWVGCETILLVRSDEDNKANVTSVYAMSMAVGYVVGPLLAEPLARVVSIASAFVAAATLASVAGVILLARLDRDDRPVEHGPSGDGGEPPTPSSVLLGRIKTACFATFAYGYFQASVVLFLPLYLVESKGISRETTIVIPAFFAGGMLAFSNLAGRLGDRVGHLRVMRALGSVGLVMVASFALLPSFPPMAAAVFVAGATLASISPLSLALQGVVTERRNTGRANAMYNVFYAAGMLLGPPISSAVFRVVGGAAMLYHLAGLWLAFVVFARVFAADDPKYKERPGGALAVPKTAIRA